MRRILGVKLMSYEKVEKFLSEKTIATSTKQVYRGVLRSFVDWLESGEVIARPSGERVAGKKVYPSNDAERIGIESKEPDILKLIEEAPVKVHDYQLSKTYKCPNCRRWVPTRGRKPDWVSPSTGPEDLVIRCPERDVVLHNSVRWWEFWTCECGFKYSVINGRCMGG